MSYELKNTEIGGEKLQVINILTSKSGNLAVYVQGNLDEKQGKTVIMTVHDVGSNHKSFLRFISHPSMMEVKQRAIFLHVCVPGQEDNAPDHFGDFPSLAQLGEDLVCVLDKCDVKTCIAVGEGAGANIVCRFAMAWPNRVMGICLIHCTSTTAGIIEYCKDKLINLRLDSGVMTQSAWEYLAFHKFGSGGHGIRRQHSASPIKGDNKRPMAYDFRAEKKDKQAFIEELKLAVNPKNLSKYLYSFSKRTDLSTVIGSKLDNMDVLLVAGSKASHLHTVYTTHKAMNKKKTTLLVVDGVGDVMAEAPDNLARALILLCKGCGVLSGVAIPGMERQRTLSSSMEEADRPRRLSTTQQPPIGQLNQ